MHRARELTPSAISIHLQNVGFLIPHYTGSALTTKINLHHGGSSRSFTWYIPSWWLVAPGRQRERFPSSDTHWRFGLIGRRQTGWWSFLLAYNPTANTRQVESRKNRVLYSSLQYCCLNNLFLNVTA